MPDALDRLAARYATQPGGRGVCPNCKQRATEARVVVQVRRIRRAAERDSQKHETAIINRVRSLCGECAAEVAAKLIEALPPDPRP
jgi:hypothetical protein